jgi:hypothetical protein
VSNQIDMSRNAQSWKLMVHGAKRGAEEEQGYKLSRVPGRGLSNVWTAEKDGKTKLVSIRTTRDRWIAFQPLEKGKRWKTLDKADLVIVAAVDDKEDPKNIQVYIFPAAEVRQRFDAAFKARSQEGHKNKDNFGMWVALDTDDRGIAASVGSGLADKYNPVATYPIEALAAELHGTATDYDVAEVDVDDPDETRPTTIGEVMTWARMRVAELAGVHVDRVKLDLKVEY